MNILRHIALALFIVLSALPVSAQESSDTRKSVKDVIMNTDFQLSARTNLLRWATLTPDLGVECRINNNIGILINGSWTTWSWNDKDRRYALREIMPEIRWYIGKSQRGYIGAMYKAGAFNYKMSETGKEGNINGLGITGGYQLPLNSCLSLDFSLAVGYLHASYDKYNVIDGVRVRAGHDRKNWFGPVNAGVTLVWNIL